MNTSEILNSLENVENFVGVFPLDSIPFIESGSLIVNTQSKNLPGQHWVCATITETDIYYFDPLNYSISVILYKYFVSLNKNLIQIPYSSQDKTSTLCGLHCIFFIKYGLPPFNDVVLINKVL